MKIIWKKYEKNIKNIIVKKKLKNINNIYEKF